MAHSWVSVNLQGDKRVLCGGGGPILGLGLYVKRKEQFT